MIDFNKSIMKAKAVNQAINDRIDAAMVETAPLSDRKHLGPSLIGKECLRAIQLGWKRPKPPSPRLQRIAWRGNTWEPYAKSLMEKAGFVFADGRGGFSQLGGAFAGSDDGNIIKGPKIEGVAYPCLWEHKALGQKSFAQIERHGLAKGKPEYADQVSLYQAYHSLDENPAIFTISNVNDGDLLHLLIPFDAARAQAASDKAVAVVKATEAGQLLPRIDPKREHWSCKFCDHFIECGIFEKNMRGHAQLPRLQRRAAGGGSDASGAGSGRR